MTQDVLSVPAEEACRVIQLTLGQHRVSLYSLQVQSSHLPRIMNRDRGIQMLRHGTYLRMLAVAEAFSTERLATCVEDQVSKADVAYVRATIDSAITRATSSWGDQRQSFKEWLGVDESASWKVIEGLAEARNAIAHGLGKFTRRQRRNPDATKTKLTEVGISLSADKEVLLDEDVLRSVADQCIAFIETLDRAIRERDPNFT